MRNAIVRLPAQRAIEEQPEVLSAAARQLDRAEAYLTAVLYMDLGDPTVDRALSRLRADIDGLHRYLTERRDGANP